MGTSFVWKMARNRIVRVIVIVFFIFMGIGIIRSVYRLSQKRDILASQEETLARLEEKNRQLTGELREATSSAFIERAARNKLGLVREGETVVIMDKAGISKQDQEKTGVQLSHWKQWWGLFF